MERSRRAGLAGADGQGDEPRSPRNLPLMLRRLAREHAVLLAIMAAGALLRFGSLASQGFWFDEWLAIEVIRLAPHDMLERILAAETNPPLYFLVAGGWERVFGAGEIGLRSLSALLGTATIAVVYVAARDLTSRRVGLLAAALTATSPFLIWYSQEARPYALLTFLSAVSFLCFVRVLNGSGDRWLWAWAVASMLAIGTHYLAGLLVIAEAAWLLTSLRSRRAEVALASAAIASGVAPLVLLAAAQNDLTSWIPFIDRTDRLLQIPQHFLVGMSAPWPAVGPVVGGLALVAAVIAAVRMRGRGARGVVVAAGVTSTVLALVLIGAAVGSDFINTRNLIEIWAPVAVVLAGLFAATRITWAFGVALCALGVVLSVWVAATPEAGRPDWDEVAAAIGADDTGRAVISDTTFTAPLQLYLDGTVEPAPGTSAAVSRLDVLTLRPTEDYSIGPCWWVAFCGGREIIGEASLPFEIPEPFRLTAEGTAGPFHYARYAAAEPVALPPAGVDHKVLLPAAG